MSESPRVLVVDDDEIIRDFVSEALADEGYEIRTASNGRRALDVLHEWKPNLIVLDLMMPEMDGWAFRAEQRKLPDAADVPVVVLSAVRDLRAQAAALEAASVLGKPFELDELLRTVGRFIK
jgi:two-component system, chemotaxis family, chemotaxis protein CheY